MFTPLFQFLISDEMFLKTLVIVDVNGTKRHNVDWITLQETDFKCAYVPITNDHENAYIHKKGSKEQLLMPQFADACMHVQALERERERGVSPISSQTEPGMVL